MNRSRVVVVIAGAVIAALAVSSAQGGYYYPPPPVNPPAPPPMATMYALSVATNGTGGGTITSTPAGIACGSDCSESYAAGAMVILTASPDAGSTFTGWSGACTGTAGCSITMDAAKTVAASFAATTTAAAADTTVAARLVGASIAHDARGRRVVQVRLSADEQLRVEIRLVRGGKSLAKRTLAAFAAGQRTVKLLVSQDVSGGRARLDVDVGDEAGNTNSFTRALRLPAPA